jgi:hypothetical protein
MFFVCTVRLGDKNAALSNFSSVFVLYMVKRMDTDRALSEVKNYSYMQGVGWGAIY